MTTNNDRYNRGWQRLLEIDGEVGRSVVENLSEICPDLGRYIIEYTFGDLYSRPGLADKDREIAVVAALTAMGTAMPQLSVHLNATLNVGCTISDLKEVILQMTAYAGFPKCMNGMNTLMEVLRDRQTKGIVDPPGSAPSADEDRGETRFEHGARELSDLDALQVGRLHETYGEFAPEMIRHILEFGYADIHGRDNLSKRYRQIATIAALTAMANAQPQLLFHIKGGLTIGLTVEEIREVILLMSAFAGFPAAINGMNTLMQAVHEFGE